MAQLMSEDVKLQDSATAWQTPNRDSLDIRYAKLNYRHNVARLPKEEQVAMTDQIGFAAKLLSDWYWPANPSTALAVPGRTAEASDKVQRVSKGLAVGPFTWSPDLLGMAADTFNFATRVASERIYGDQRGAWNERALSGDPLREVVGIDPSDPYSMVGEILGGWENMVAKVGTAGFKAIPIMIGTAMGKRAKLPRSMIQNYEKFKAMGELKPYDSAAWKETGWYYGEDGQARIMLSDVDADIHPGFLQNQPRIESKIKAWENTGQGQNTKIRLRLDQVLDYPLLFEAYPQIGKMKISLSIGVDAATGDIRVVSPMRPDNKGGIQHSLLGDIDGMTVRNAAGKADFLDTILHEVQHVIQEVEGFASGGNPAVGWEVLDRLQNNNAMTGIFDIIDKGNIKTPDDLYTALEKLPPEMQEVIDIEQVVAVPRFSRYMNSDDLARNEMRIEIAGDNERARDEVGFVLDYLFALDDAHPQGLQLVRRIEDEMTWRDTDDLAQRAYENMYGEAEARLTEVSRRTTQKRLDAGEGPLRPDEASRREPADFPLTSTDPSKRQGRVLEFHEATGQTRRAGPQSTEGINRNRGGVDGGGLDMGHATWEPRNPLPEGTHQTVDATKRRALQTLMDKNSTGEAREAARHTLVGSRFKSISDEELFDIADELGMLAE